MKGLSIMQKSYRQRYASISDLEDSRENRAQSVLPSSRFGEHFFIALFSESPAVDGTEDNPVLPFNVLVRISSLRSFQKVKQSMKRRTIVCFLSVSC
ncbi:unnamed protein product [Calypogeia fissa]